MPLLSRSARHSTLQVTLRHQIWRIAMDGAFYGDYRSRASAVEDAELVATALRKGGCVVTILGPPDAAR